mgnify:CR=1 FL=1|tara:strand:+ start:1123 stop:1326 length:204 start_codon:yes stop_codon:yes gene_type:complete
MSEKEESVNTQPPPPPQIDLLKVEIIDENTALNVLVGFLGLAQRRGVFALNESAKIYEAIQKFKAPE